MVSFLGKSDSLSYPSQNPARVSGSLSEGCTSTSISDKSTNLTIARQAPGGLLPGETN